MLRRMRRRTHRVFCFRDGQQSGQTGTERGATDFRAANINKVKNVIALRRSGDEIKLSTVVSFTLFCESIIGDDDEISLAFGKNIKLMSIFDYDLYKALGLKRNVY